ncbi:hypothetical protein ELI_4340 [Eubacterium callanderi]|uniref:Uncharacterized protein n=1 Tax=Eubacterium callanderi TaxID=53442 RepID=E3GQI7_9FIRM|nr:hypothetical protein ELI_4340 [Eubacterium callanderi]
MHTAGVAFYREKVFLIRGQRQFSSTSPSNHKQPLIFPPLFLDQLLDFPDFGHAFFGPGILKQVLAGEGGFWQDFAF